MTLAELSPKLAATVGVRAHNGNVRKIRGHENDPEAEVTVGRGHVHPERPEWKHKGTPGTYLFRKGVDAELAGEALGVLGLSRAEFLSINGLEDPADIAARKEAEKVAKKVAAKQKKAEKAVADEQARSDAEAREAADELEREAFKAKMTRVNEMSVPQLEEALKEINDSELLSAMFDAEKANKDRKTALDAIEERIGEVSKQ